MSAEVTIGLVVGCDVGIDDVVVGDVVVGDLVVGDVVVEDLVGESLKHSVHCAPQT